MWTGFRAALSIWLLYNMWTGHPWALYALVTFALFASELQGYYLMKVISQLGKMARAITLFATKEDKT